MLETYEELALHFGEIKSIDLYWPSIIYDNDIFHQINGGATLAAFYSIDHNTVYLRNHEQQKELRHELIHWYLYQRFNLRDPRSSELAVYCISYKLYGSDLEDIVFNSTLTKKTGSIFQNVDQAEQFCNFLYYLAKR